MSLADLQREFWGVLRGGPPASFVAGADRMQVYADMFLCRQIDVLRADFPQTLAKLGDEKFNEIAREYILAHPSEDPDLGRLGCRFAEFCGAPEAALDWARCEVFLEAEVPRLGPEEFARTLYVKVVPALRLCGNTVVWRTPGGYDLNEVDLPEDERRALERALRGEPFEDVCAAFGEPGNAFEALQSWLAEGWLQKK